MKYINRLTDNELREIYTLFIDSNGKINQMDISKDDDCIHLEGYIEIPEFYKEILKQNPNATLVIDDDYDIDDFNVKTYCHSGNCTSDYRRWMYNKFGDEYARDYLFND